MDPLDPQRFRPPPTLTGPEVAARAGVSYEFSQRILRALGFPDVPDDAVEFDESDVEVLAALGTIMSLGFDEEDVMSVARTYGYSISRIAHAEVRLFNKTFIVPLRESGTDDETIAAKLDEIVPELLDLLARQLDHMHRRHLRNALAEIAGINLDGESELITVGFVDLVDFTQLSEAIGTGDIGDLVSRFETVALEGCVDQGAHLVKMIGDAAMFVARDPGPAVAAALAIVEAVEKDDDLPAARAGLDRGEAVPLGGDYFGHPVNVAARLTSFARPGTVVVTFEVIDTLPERADISRIGKIRLKGTGPVRAFKLNAYPAPLEKERAAAE